MNVKFLLLFLFVLVSSSVFATNLNDVKGDKLVLSKYVQNILLSTYNPDREYATCIDARYYDNTFHASSLASFSGSPLNVSYSNGIFYGSKYRIWTYCNSAIQLHSHPDDFSNNCYPSSVDLDGWKNFTSVKLFIIQCSKHDLMIYESKDLNKGVVKGYEYKI